MTRELQLDRQPAVSSMRGDSRTQLYLDIQRGTWTPPVQLGRASTWPRHETQALIAARIAGATAEDLRVLVEQLLVERKALMPQLNRPEAA